MIKALYSNFRLPKYLQKNIKYNYKKELTLKILRKFHLNTVCEESHCPNINECFSKNTATFMILGDICTRNCAFCNVQTGKPTKIDYVEPFRLLNAIRDMNLKYIVITSVNRDELFDYGASYFSKYIKIIQKNFPYIIIEILTPDFHGEYSHIIKVIKSKPDVFCHNIETVKRLFQKLKPQSKWADSCSLLSQVSKFNNIILKSSMMLGLGETNIEVEDTLYQLRELGVNVVTIGQYLRPSLKHAPVSRYVKNDVYSNLINFGKKLGFKAVIAGPFVRSSYMAKECYYLYKNNKAN